MIGMPRASDEQIEKGDAMPPLTTIRSRSRKTLKTNSRTTQPFSLLNRIHQKTIFPGDFCMSRLNVLAPAAATGETKVIYDELTKRMGKVINIFQAMGNSSAALNAYLSMAGALAQGELTPEDREVIYLAVSEDNGCHYCVSAHTMIAERAGMSVTEILAARRFQTPDAKRQALLQFVRRVIDTKGHVSDAELAAVRVAGYTDGQIAESVAYIGLATYSNLFNHVHQTDLDFPSAPEL